MHRASSPRIHKMEVHKLEIPCIGNPPNKFLGDSVFDCTNSVSFESPYSRDIQPNKPYSKYKAD